MIKHRPLGPRLLNVTTLIKQLAISFGRKCWRCLFDPKIQKYVYKICNSKKEKRQKEKSRSIVGGEMNAPAKNVQRAANESDHRGFPRELHELVERRCRRRRQAPLPPLPHAAHCRRPAPLPPPPPLIARAGLAALRREASRELGTIAAPAVAHRPPSRRRLRIKWKPPVTTTSYFGGAPARESPPYQCARRGLL